ncbi:MAG: VacJ lipoprotein precursor [Rickettsiaceae bacterium]|jgi:phospholipid-binding lipoprotein MlaA|nr:VacJ lipoprotein precursor [Rickettsiaceae bacterium]
MLEQITIIINRENIMNIIKKFSLFLLLITFTKASVFAQYTKSEDFETTNYPNYDLDAEECMEINDPYEGFNRKVFVFNSFLDYVLLKPVAKSYKILVPDFAKDRVGSFLSNLTEPVTVVNNVLQLRARDTVKSIWRFVINTTVGIGGTFDVASKLGIKSDPQTFGSTLARYGVKPGPYLILPFFGSTNGRDVTDIFVLSSIDPVKYNMNKYQKNGYTAASMIHKRSEILEITDAIARESADPYAAIRSLVHQKREHGLRYPEKLKGKCARP